MAQTVPDCNLLTTLMNSGKNIALINVASQLGAGCTAKGYGWFSRVESIRKHLENRNLKVPEIYNIQEPDLPLMGDTSSRYADGVLNVLQRVKARIGDCLERQMIPVTIGGDHSIAIGSVAASSAHLHKHLQGPLGLLWLDAHMDMNSPSTTPSGNIHGMALATLLGQGCTQLAGLFESTPPVRPEHTAVVGFRFADLAELPNVAAAGSPAIVSMREIDQASISGVMEKVLPRVAADTGGVHLSLDLDSLDPSVAPSVNTPFPGGLTFREARTVCDTIAATGQLLSLDIVEHNPEKGYDDQMLPLMAELIACALGGSAMPEIPLNSQA